MDRNDAIGPVTLAALSALHSRGIVQVDLEPANVFLTLKAEPLLDSGSHDLGWRAARQTAGKARLCRRRSAAYISQFWARSQEVRLCRDYP